MGLLVKIILLETQRIRTKHSPDIAGLYRITNRNGLVQTNCLHSNTEKIIRNKFTCRNTSPENLLFVDSRTPDSAAAAAERSSPSSLRTLFLLLLSQFITPLMLLFFRQWQILLVGLHRINAHEVGEDGEPHVISLR